MPSITEIAKLVRENVDQSLIVTEINSYLDNKYANDLDNRPTAQEWVTANSDLIIKWLILEYQHKIIEAFLMTRSSDTTLQTQGQARIDNYISIYMDLRNRLGV
jgi:hypothetical protein